VFEILTQHAITSRILANNLLSERDYQTVKVNAMKKLITIAIPICVAAASFQAGAITIIPPQTSPALLLDSAPEPSTFTLILASAFAFCLLKDKLNVR
jgi:hypothetical protein